MKLGEKIFSNIESNEYLQELFETIIYNYSLKLFSFDEKPRSLNLIDALRFADLLSKSIDITRAEIHQTWAQEIVALLSKLYPEDKVVKYYTGSVLNNVSNYRGLFLESNAYTPLNTLEQMFDQYKKNFLKIPFSDDKYFFQSQKQVYNSLTRNQFSYSGPTSMGKSFVIRMFIKERVLQGKQDNFAIVVPTKALINETSSKIIADLQHLLAEKNYRVVTNSGAISLQHDHHFILVLTPERLLYLLLEREDFQLDFLFIDEAHKISSKDSRSPFYYKIVSLLNYRNHRPHFIFSSPNIPNPEIYLNLLSTKMVAEDKLSTFFSPVSQLKYIVDLVSQKLFLYNDYNNSFIEIPITQKYISLNRIIYAVGSHCQNIIYCNSTANAIQFAREYADSISSTVTSDELTTLSHDIATEIHSDYYLAELILKGVAYHVGYLPGTIRTRIEELFRKGKIKTIFCTSTLVEGINLPADNLFITSYKNGRSNMTTVDFKNLVGRVGRIEYNLYGNVFLVRLDKKIDTQKYQNLLEKNVPVQSLSLSTELSKNQKQLIVENLLKGQIELPHYPKNQTNDNYAVMRKFALILLNDIVSKRPSIVHESFSDYLDFDKEEQIRKAFETKPLDNDINISVDQVENLTKKIEDGLCYPPITQNGNFEYNKLVEFLEQLCEAFKWDVYESSTLGYVGKRSGDHRRIRWYAVILSQWIHGKRLSFIMEDAINYKRKDSNACIEINGAFVPYDDSKFHRNIVISDTLNAIEDVVLFRILNYFCRFSEEYKRIHHIETIKYDWYEFVEYGTTNSLSIFLQRNGLSREVATYIKKHHEYICVIAGEYKVDSSILSCPNEMVCKELYEMKYNVPELFV